MSKFSKSANLEIFSNARTDNKCTEKTSQKHGIPVIGLVITVIAAVVLLLNLIFIVLVGRRYKKQGNTVIRKKNKNLKLY